MSLINDALRRANSDKSRGPESAAPVPPMQPVEPSSASPKILPWAILVLGVGVLAIGAALLFRPRSAPEIARNESSISAGASGVATVESGPELVSHAQPGSAQPVQTAAVAPAPTPEPAKTILEQTPVQPAPVISPTPAITPAVKLPEPESVPAETRPAEVNNVAATAPATTEPITVSPEPRQTQAPRLQAIYYRFKKPTVVINGKTLSPGQSADGIKVVSIQRTSVEVVQDGKYRTLTLQD